MFINYNGKYGNDHPLNALMLVRGSLSAVAYVAAHTKKRRPLRNRRFVPHLRA